MGGFKATTALFMLTLCKSFFSVVSEPDVVTAPMERTEQEALHAALRGIVGNGWNGSELYPDPCGWTPIQGVSCDLFEGMWYVTVLNIGPIYDNSLECANDAKLDEHLFELKHLTSISFFNCFTSTDRPATLASDNWNKLATSLRALEFRSNRGLIGTIPSTLGSLTNLESLVLIENALNNGEIPRELDNLFNLKRLSLAGNSLSGPIPSTLGNSLSNLLILDLSRNSLTGPVPPSLGNMHSLLKLDLSYNCLNGTLPNELSTLRNLTLLDLRNNSICGGWLQALQGMVSIQEVLLSNNPMGGNLMAFFEWKILINLTTLDLSNLSITGEIPESMTGLRRLRFLALDNNYITGSVSAEFADLPCINSLHISSNNLTGELRFPEGFYKKMGRRFAAWNNPNLCYNASSKSAGYVPLGVDKCEHEKENYISITSEENKRDKENRTANSDRIASVGRSAASITRFKRVILAPLLSVFLFVMLL
ncbi:piriformospora indica-insensitive protein 2-like [Ananas comosus]|uniref:Piriformospora indica-insensitive protein 2-like n=1 Tax=Ananas comosus TaxID=4615 RepID=A0A6P5FTI5_ANACO|nr:piriformospora indica-insensitive protein 2-like [Ananas comosus]